MRLCTMIDNIDDLPYKIINRLGDGKSSIVYLAVDKNNNKVAIKTIQYNINKIDGHNIELEAILLNNLNHRNIPKFYGFYCDKINYYIIMEYIHGEPMLSYINKNKGIVYRRLKNITKQLVDVIAYMHKNNVIHRDIKLENMILEYNTDRIVLIDFGFSDIIKYDKNGKELQFNRFCGSPLYVAPELWEHKPYYGRKIDIWSLGVSIYVISFGSFPYGNDEKDMYSKIKEREPDFSSDYIELTNFLKSMMGVNPNDRINADILLHSPWLTDKKIKK